jgi:hypothetical protein
MVAVHFLGPVWAQLQVRCQKPIYKGEPHGTILEPSIVRGRAYEARETYKTATSRQTSYN